MDHSKIEEKPDVDPGFEVERIVDRISEIWHESRAAARRSLDDKPTTEQFWILRFIADNGPKPIKEIAAHLGTTSSPVTIAVKKMERLGLVERRRRSDDERVVWVDLTSIGRELLERWRQERRRLLVEAFELLEDEEKKVLGDLLEKAASGLHAKLVATASGQQHKK